MEEPVQLMKPATSTRVPILNVLHFLTQHHEGFLVVGSVVAASVYALGFLTWAFHSLRIGLGFIDVFRAQYVVAGIVPSILIFLSMYYIGKAQQNFSYRGWGVTLCFIFAIVRIVTITIDYGTHIDIFRLALDLLGPIGVRLRAMVPGFSRLSFYVFYLFLAVNMFHWLFIRAKSTGPPGISRYFSSTVAFGAVIVFLVLSVVEYIGSVFPHMPPEIGGGQERCARLDVELDKLSLESGQILIEQDNGQKTQEFPSPSIAPAETRVQVIENTNKKEKSARKKKDPDSTAETSRTRDVYIVYLSDKSIFFSTICKSDIYQISRDAVTLISWCQEASTCKVKRQR